MNPAVQPFNKYAEKGAYHYDATIGARHWRRFDLRLTARYMTAVKLLDPQPGWSVLDAGSGEGVASLLCCRRGASATALEWESEACRIGRKLAEGNGLAPERLQFVQGDLYRLPFPDGSFDGIVSLEVIEHMADVRAYLSELHRVLKPGGRMVVSTPHKLSTGELQDPYHVREFDAATLDAVVRDVFKAASVLSGWPGWLNEFYESNRPLKVAGQMRRNLLRLAGYAGLNVFVGGAAYSPKCPLLYAVATK